MTQLKEFVLKDNKILPKEKTKKQIEQLKSSEENEQNKDTTKTANQIRR